MSTFAKLLIIPALVVAFSVGVGLAASGGGSGSPLAQVAPTTSTDGTTTVDTPIGTTTTDDDGREPGEDVRGPCDEAEHADDPGCTGTGDDRGDDSGPGSADDRGGDDDRGHDDRAGHDDGGGDHRGSHGVDEDDDDHRGGHGDHDEDDR